MPNPPTRQPEQRPSFGIYAVAAIALALAVVAGLGGWLATRGPAHPAAVRAALVRRAPRLATRRRALPRASALHARPAGRLPAALQDAAATAQGSVVLLLGGLSASDLSTASITAVSPRRTRLVGRLPGPLHDAAAASLGGAAYLFGGGNGLRQLDEIVRVEAGGHAVSVVGRLPSPSSDQAAAAIGGTAYVVGGFTGTRWLDTIVAWQPGKRARVVARLPSPLRYAAVAAAGGRLVIAGGSLPDGSASSAVFTFRPGARRVRPLGALPAPTTHAAAAALRGVVYVIGGRGVSTASPNRRILAVLPSGRVRPAGRLPAPLSDASAAPTARGTIVVAGGRGPTGTQASLLELSRAGGRRSGRAAVQRVAAARPPRGRGVYAADGANMLAPAARFALPRIYVPNSLDNSVDVIDPRTRRVVGRFPVGGEPQHVTPAWDLRTLYVLDDTGNELTPVDPTTGRPGKPIPVEDPYNLYFTPDGRFAIVVAERLNRLDFRDPHTFRLRRSVPLSCVGVDHMDFSADGSYLLASCEFSGQLVKVDLKRRRLAGTLRLPDGLRGMPQDVKLAPDGKIFYVADMRANGLWEIDGARLRVVGFLHTGKGVHGLYPSRDSKLLYATNREAGSVSVISFRKRRVLATWHIPGGGSPDMGGVSADGRVLWVSGRYDGVVYALSTSNGRLLARIRVGRGPHGLCVWPQPGRYSLGHTGILR